MAVFSSPPIAANCDLDGCQLANLEAENRTLFNSLEKANENAVKLRADLAALIKQCEWQPIETAPRDGTDILAWVPSLGDKSGRWLVVRFDTKYDVEGPEGLRWKQHAGFYNMIATKWLPLPPE